MTIQELIKQYLSKSEIHSNLDSKTIKAYRLDLNQFGEYVGNRENFHSKDIIIEYINLIKEKGYAIKTIKRKIASLKAFFSYLNYEDIIEMNPFHKIKIRMKEPFILPKTISETDLSNLFICVNNELKKSSKKTYRYKEIVRDRVILELLIGTGMRISEICSLKKENVLYTSNIIKIYGKGAKERIIPIYHPSLLEAIKLYEKEFNKELKKSNYFFINKRKNKLSSQSARNMIKKYCKLGEIETNITPHMFRHTFATLLLEQDVDSRNIQILLGHSNIMTTQIYTHITSNKKNEIMKYKNPRSQIKTNEG